MGNSEDVVENLVWNVSEEGHYAWVNYSSGVTNIQDDELRQKAEEAVKLADEFEKAHLNFLRAAEAKGYKY